MRLQSVLLLAVVAGCLRYSPAGSGKVSEGSEKFAKVFCLDAVRLAKSRKLSARGDKSLQPAIDALREEAEEALGNGPYSVMDKKLTPDSGDKHDYMSLGPYWWPDPKKADGLPYIRRDGEVNPESRTNDTARLTRLIDAIAILELSDGWTSGDRRQMRQWCAAYLKWLRTSRHGLGEEKKRNNHGTWYDAQVVSLALYVDQEDVARGILEQVKSRRINKHIEPNGAQPHELARTKSLGYSRMNLEGFSRCCDEAVLLTATTNTKALSKRSPAKI